MYPQLLIASGATRRLRRICGTLGIALLATVACQSPSATTTGDSVTPAATASRDGISAERAKELGVFATPGDAAIQGTIVSEEAGRVVVLVTIANISEVDDEYRVTALLAEEELGTGTVRVAAGTRESLSITLSEEARGHTVYLELSGGILGPEDLGGVDLPINI